MKTIEGKLTPRMPYKEDPLSRSDVELIRRWIDAVAPPPTDKDAAPRGDVTVPDINPTVPAMGAVATIAFDPATRRIAPAGYNTCHVTPLTHHDQSATHPRKSALIV